MKLVIVFCMVALCSINSIQGSQVGNICEDIQTADVCKSWQHLCAGNPHVAEVCKKSCNLCPTVPPTQNPTQQTTAPSTQKPCFNIKSSYQCWLWRPLCKVNKTVQRLCQHRCKLCPRGTAAPSTVAPSASAAPSATSA
ncbi:uncharacterized protein [Clytia hemisphaerica]|uniref:ShKT domain-containing protein n=1 Tax=Clytia hemisphaerica TaxID=252671 RepID=A0A7M5U2N5_9CNID